MQQEKQNFSDYLTLIYNATYMPMHYIIEQEIVGLFPSWAMAIPEVLVYQSAVAQSDVTFDYIVTQNDLYLGIVRNPATEEAVVLGPIPLTPLSHTAVEELAKSFAEDETTYQKLLEFFERTPDFSLSRFLNIMAVVNTALNNELLDVNAMYREKVSALEAEISRSHSDELMARKENENFHNTYFFEQEYFGYLERGDVEGLTEFIKVVPSYTEGSMANDSIRQSKNIFITTITLATRHAIAGGLDIETAYQLSDSYIQEMEKMSDAAAITMLINTAIFDFTKRVAEAKIPKDMSVEIFHCIQYISNHVNQDITVEHLADLLHMDRSTLSKKFKRELGFNISAFIMRRKLEEAKTLLLHTDKTVSEISEYLCFSSQAYFQNVFKKKYGVTPREFRQKK